MKILNCFFFIFFTCFSLGNAAIAASPYPNAKEAVVKTNNAQIFCRVFGKGDPIVVIHGGPGLSQDYLLPQMTKLAETHCVIFYDQRGCGLSTGEINPDTIQVRTFLEDLEAVRKSLGYKKITVLGHSWGGFLAMQYAIWHPESINKLILLHTMSPSSEELHLFQQEWTKRMAPYQDAFKAIQETPAFAEGDPAIVEKYYRIMFKTYCYNPDKAYLLNLCMSPKAFIDGMKVYEMFQQNLFTKPYDFHNQLKQVKIPTLIIHGDFDPIPPSTAQTIHEDIRNSKYVLIKNCGHFSYVETPDELFKPLTDFLDKP